MGNFTLRNEREKVRREKLAGYLYDVSKLIVGGMVIGTIVTGNDISIWLKLLIAVIGIFAAYIFAQIANRNNF